MSWKVEGFLAPGARELAKVEGFCCQAPSGPRLALLRH